MVRTESLQIWLLIFALGAVTYLIRLSFIWLFNRWQPPEWLKRSLRFVPITILMAIIVPNLVMPAGVLLPVTGNARLWAGLIAALVAWKTKNVILTIVAGMAALFVFYGWMGYSPE